MRGQLPIRTAKGDRLLFAPMPTREPTSSSLGGDVAGGFASAVVSIPGNVAAGVIAFAPLGPEYAGQGILAGMSSSIVAGLLCALLGGAPGMIAGPKATTSMAFAAMLATLIGSGVFDLSSEADAQLLLTFAYGGVLLSGAVQVGLGVFRVGGLVEFMPYPVVAGIRNTTAILLIVGQSWTLFGIPRQSFLELFGSLGQIQVATLVVGLVTALCASKGSRFLPKPAVPVVALLVGAATHYLLAGLIPGVALGAVLGTLPSALPTVSEALPLLEAARSARVLELLPAVVAGALAMAVLDSISAMISLVSYSSLADRRFDANKQLTGQGLGTVVNALFGGLTTSGILARAAVNHRAGGRTRLSGVVNAVGVLFLLVVLARPLALLPKAAIAGLIMVIASSLFDRWSFDQLREALRSDAHERRDNILATVQMGFVVLVGVTVNLVAAVGAGIALSVVVFVAQMSRSPVRRVRSGATVKSARNRDPDTTRLLSESGHRIAVLELEGTIFFGTAEALATHAERLADEGTDFVILDMKRVQSVDATGFKVLGQTFKRLRTRGTTLGFSYIQPEVQKIEMAEDLLNEGVPEARMWGSTDRALEYFEDGLLLKLGADDFDEDRWTLEAFGTEWGLAPEESAILARYVDERDYEGGEPLFSEGEDGRSMFLVRYGSADISIRMPGEQRRHRVGTASRGTVIGEIAMLDGGTRSASAIAAGPLTAYELRIDRFAELLEDEPVVAAKVKAGVARILAERLRRATALIIDLES